MSYWPDNRAINFRPDPPRGRTCGLLRGRDCEILPWRSQCKDIYHGRRFRNLAFLSIKPCISVELSFRNCVGLFFLFTRFLDTSRWGKHNIIIQLTDELIYEEEKISFDAILFLIMRKRIRIKTITSRKNNFSLP